MLFKRNRQDFPGIQTEAKSREKPRSARVKTMLGIEQILPNPRLVHDRYMRILKLHVPSYLPPFKMVPGKPECSKYADSRASRQFPRKSKYSVTRVAGDTKSKAF